MRLKNGELKTPEIRKLIRAHNVLVSIKIPKGSKREDIIRILSKEGYRIDHENGRLRPIAKGKVKKMKVIGQGTIQTVLRKPKPKTELEKQKAAEKKEEKEMEKKKELRKVKKELADKIINREKNIKEKTRNNKKKKMKEDEVRPKEKVGRPKVDPNKIKVIAPKKDENSEELKPFFWNYGNDEGLEYGTNREVGTTPEQMIKAITDKKFKVSKKAEKEITAFMKKNANNNNKQQRSIIIFQKTSDIDFGSSSGNQKLKTRAYRWEGISFGNPFAEAWKKTLKDLKN